MEETKAQTKTAEKKNAATKKKTVLKKVDLEAAKLLAALKEQANKKHYGRNITEGEILSKAITLLNSEHLKELQDLSFSETDRLHIAHENYVKQNGKITLDQFIGRLLKGDIKPPTGS